MKSVYIFCTKWYVFLTELPLFGLLAASIAYNKHAEGLLKLYPLITALSLGIIFYFLYFFRMISISYDEIRYIGLFSSKDRAVINKDKTVILSFHSLHKIKVRLFGSDGKAPSLDWAQNSDNFTPVDYFLFRGKAVGGFNVATRVLKYFSVPAEDCQAFIKGDHTAEYENVLVTSATVNGNKEIRIKITKTV